MLTPRFRFASMSHREVLSRACVRNGVRMQMEAQEAFDAATKLPAPFGPWEELAQVLLLSNEFAVAE